VVSVTRDGVWIGNWIYWTLTFVTENNYDSFTKLHASDIIVTTAHIKSSQSSLVVGWYLFPVADDPLPLGSRTVTSLCYQLLTSHNCDSQLTQLTTELLVLVTQLQHRLHGKCLFHYRVFFHCGKQHVHSTVP
jgi:hypothetical protein